MKTRFGAIRQLKNHRKSGVNWYDYGARFYDPELGVWHTGDPLAAKYYGVSPYAYCAGNPVNRIDPDGRSIYYLIRNNNGNVTNQLTYRNGNFLHENGSRYNPQKESLSKDLYKTLVSYRKIEKSGDKVLINQLKTLEKSGKSHFVEAGEKGKGSGVISYEKGMSISEKDDMVKKGTPIGS